MASKAQKIQTNFNGGILSPYIEGRPDVAQYFNGVRVCRNFALLPEGGLESMPGSQFMKTTKDNGLAKLIAFEPNDDNSFEIEAGVGYFRFRKNGVEIRIPGPELITDPGFDDSSLAAWTDGDEGAGVSSWGHKVVSFIELTVGEAGGKAARFQTITVTPGATYTLTFPIVVGTVDVIVFNFASGEVFAAGSFASVATHTINFTPTTTDVRVVFQIVYSGGPVPITGQVAGARVSLHTGVMYEIASPYNETDLLELQGGQGIRESVDVLFLCCSRIKPLELVYGGDTNWTLRESPFDPVPSVEADTDLNAEGGTSITLTPAATTGSAVNFHASGNIFLAADVGRVIVYGLARALITTVTDADDVEAEIIVAFPDTNAIPAGSWLLEGSPGAATLDVGFKEPIGRTMTATANADAFRASDVGKYIKTYGGLLEIVKYNSATSIQVKIRSPLSDSDKDNPDAAPAGSWRLEIGAWSDALGWPTLNEFYQGRYCLASNANQPTTKWFSRTNNFYNFAVGVLATDAVEYTHRSGRFGALKWLVENGNGLFFGDGRAEHSLKGRGVDQPIGGDEVPAARSESHKGSALMRPIHVGNTLLFLNWSQKKILGSAYSFDRDANIAKEATFLTRDLTADVPTGFTRGMTNHQAVYRQEPVPLILWLREDGVVLMQSFNDDPEGGNNGFTTLEMDGEIEAMCVTRRNRGNVLHLIVKRTINGSTVRWVEEIQPEVHDPTEAAWTELQTQAAIVVEKTDSTATTAIGNLSHLEGESVDVLIYKTGQAVPQVPRYLLNGESRYVVTGGQIALNETVDYPCKIEVGIPFTPFVQTMRPSVPNAPTEGRLRKWTKCMVRLRKSSLPVINGTDMQAPKSMDNFGEGPYLRSGDFFVDPSDLPDAATKKWDWSLDGFVEITRTKPYPLRVLALVGEVEFSESMGENVGNEGTIHVPE